MFIGYGSLGPQNYYDLWAVFCSAFIGNLLKAAFIGIASSMMHMMAASKRLYNEKVASVMGYLEANKVPKELSQRVTNYYEKRYAGKMFDETKVLKILNPKLRMEIIRLTFNNKMNKKIFFKDTIARRSSRAFHSSKLRRKTLSMRFCLL